MGGAVQSLGPVPNLGISGSEHRGFCLRSATYPVCARAALWLKRSNSNPAWRKGAPLTIVLQSIRSLTQSGSTKSSTSFDPCRPISNRLAKTPQEAKEAICPVARAECSNPSSYRMAVVAIFIVRREILLKLGRWRRWSFGKTPLRKSWMHAYPERKISLISANVVSLNESCPVFRCRTKNATARQD